MILEAALRMLIRDGYPSINIKTLAAEAGCSTQPIAWHFENMEGLRRALTVYAREYAEKKIATCADNAVDAFEEMGRARMLRNDPARGIGTTYSAYTIVLCDGEFSSASHHRSTCGGRTVSRLRYGAY